MGSAVPAQARIPAAICATPSLAEVLNPDGTLRTGASGSFNAKGFRMGTALGGRPVFKAAGIAGAGDERWRSGFGPQGLNGVVNAVATNGSDVYVGGDFTTAGSISASRVAKWNGSSWSSLGTGINSSVLALAVDGNGSLYAGGTFAQAGGATVSNIAKWNGSAWSALGSGTNASVYALLAQGTDVYVGGQFNVVGGTATGPLAKWNGSAWSAVGSGVSGTVRALTASGSNLYAGGSLGLAGTTVPVARWNGTAWSSLSTNLTGTVSTLAATPNGTVYAGGNLSISGASVRNLVRWNGTAWIGVGTAWSGTVHALAIVGPALYVGGSFTQASGGGIPANNIAKWNGLSWSSLGTGLNGGVLALAGSGGNVLHAGGNFTAVGDGSLLTTRYAEYNTIPEAPMVIDPMSGAVGETITITGWDLASATAVTFNGTNAPGFTRSADECTITVNVPAGTTNGPISLALPGGASTSSGSFILMRAGSAVSFPFAGTPRTYTVPADVTDLRVVALGASRSYITTTGRGARVTARLRVVPGEVLTVVAGGSGGEATNTTPGSGGYNGGGKGGATGSSPYSGISFNPGHGGSGASDVRRIAGARSSDPLGGGTLAGTLGSRLLIAGGAGGRDGNADANGAGNANEGGKAGATMAGGAGGTTANTTAGGGARGTLGSGGDGGRGSTDNGSEGGSGGGGGHYGGGGGAGSTNGSIQGGSGGGGSSYVVPAEIISGTTPSVELGTHAGQGSLVLTSYYFVPMLTSFTPSDGPAGSTAVTITGSYFGGATSVSFNGTNAPGFTVNAAGTQITLTVPNGATTGPISVTTAGGTATSTSSYTVGPGLAIASFTPTLGPVSTSVTITGSAFTGATAVAFNGTAASSFTVNSPTSITATVASGSTSGPISVTTPSGMATSTASFTVTVPDLTISSAQTISGAYNNITVSGTGVATLGGPLTVSGALTVETGGQLLTACQPVTGSGSFELQAGGTLGVCDAAGITSSGATGAVQVTGLRSFSSDALYAYNGTAAQVTGNGLPSTVRTLTLSNAADLALTSALTATAAITLTNGRLVLGTTILTLNPAATLSETATGYATGTVQTTRSLATANATESFGGLGLTLTPSGPTLPGSTLVRRVTGTALTGVGTSQSVRRYFDIQPTTRTGLNVALVLTARDDERNGIAPANLRLFKSDDNGSTWQLQRPATYATATTSGLTTYSSSLSSISNFSIWTLGDAANPLPVELMAFTAERRGESAYLTWATASEKNSAYFEAEASLDGTAFRPVSRVAAQGSTAQRHDYTLTDPRLLTYGEPLVYYRLRQVDQDGTTAYSPVRTVLLPASTGPTLFPNPARDAAALSGAAAGTTVQLLDLLGRPLLTSVADARGTTQLVLPRGLASGLYLVRVGRHALRLYLE